MTISAVAYKFYFIRALLKYKAGNYRDSYCLLKKAKTYASEENIIVHLFSAFVAILANIDGLVFENLNEYFHKRYVVNLNSKPDNLTSSELLWLDAFAQYMYAGCVGADTRPAVSLRRVELHEFERIKFDEVRVLYKKMFPPAHAPKVRQVLLDAGFSES